MINFLCFLCTNNFVFRLFRVLIFLIIEFFFLSVIDHFAMNFKWRVYLLLGILGSLINYLPFTIIRLLDRVLRLFFIYFRVMTSCWLLSTCEFMLLRLLLNLWLLTLTGLEKMFKDHISRNFLKLRHNLTFLFYFKFKLHHFLSLLLDLLL